MYSLYPTGFFMLLRRIAAGLSPLLLILSFYSSSFAGTTEEIVSLLHFIEQSECIFIRNGKQYDALEARQHIEKKYTFYKEQISTAEEFIQYSAAGSSLTGQPYSVICNGMGMKSTDWLNAELDSMRARSKDEGLQAEKGELQPQNK